MNLERKPRSAAKKVGRKQEKLRSKSQYVLVKHKKRSQTVGGGGVQSTDRESMSVDSLEKFVFEEKERYRAVFVKLMETF